MRKRAWINLTDIVLVSVREFDEDKVDILHKYNNEDLYRLKGELPLDLNLTNEVEFDNDAADENDIENI